MTVEELKDRLVRAAAALDWPASEVLEFVAPQFRGRVDMTAAPLPEGAVGLRLGAYPVIVAPVTLGSVEEIQNSLREFHNQMVIARSYMQPQEVINAHLFLCVTNSSDLDDSRTVIDLVERDEAVCRKVVWMPVPAALDESFEAFRARTFLASPWEVADERLDAKLDSNYGLAQRILMKSGLSENTAKAWIDVVDRLRTDPDKMVSELVAIRTNE
jgi:hypothetical protein